NRKVKTVLPGTTQFLITGDAFASFTTQRGEDSQFAAEFNPVFLWQLSDRLLFESQMEIRFSGSDTSFDLSYAQISYAVNDYVTPGLGKFLSPMDYFIERLHPSWINKLHDKPLAVADGLLPESNVGFQVRGAVPIGSTKLEYALYVANAPRLNTD